MHRILRSYTQGTSRNNNSDIGYSLGLDSKYMTTGSHWHNRCTAFFQRGAKTERLLSDSNDGKRVNIYTCSRRHSA